MSKKIKYQESFVENSKALTKQIKNYILKYNLLQYKCVWCGICGIYNNKPLTLQLDHINGNNTDNRIENLRFLCPNCHSQTETYKGRNKTNQKSFGALSIEQIKKALENSENINSALKTLGFRAQPHYYKICNEIINKYNIKFLQKKEKQQCEKNTKIKIAKYCQCGNPIFKNQSKFCKQCSHLNLRTVSWPEREQLKKLIRKKSFCQIGRIYGVSDNAIRKWCDYYSLPRKKIIIMKYSQEQWNNI